MDPPPLILFVCYGNICRSPLAEALARQKLERAGLAGSIRVASAGMIAWPGSPASQEMIDLAVEWGLDLSNHRARKLNAYLLDEATLVVTMTGVQCMMLQAAYPEFASRIISLGELAGSGEDVEDPYGRDLEAYRHCAAALKRLLDMAWPAIVQRLPGQTTVKNSL